MKNLLEKVVLFHKKRNLIEGSSDRQQFKKLLEEMTEVYASIRPNVTCSSIRRGDNRVDYRIRT